MNLGHDQDGNDDQSSRSPRMAVTSADGGDPAARENGGRPVEDHLSLDAGITQFSSGQGPSVPKPPRLRYYPWSVVRRFAGWDLWGKPRWAIGWLLATDLLVAVIGGLMSVSGAADLHWTDLARFVVIAGCAIAYLVGTREPEERRRAADRRTEHVDQTSTFFFAAALVLPVPLVLVLVGLVRLQRYFVARKAPHTYLFTTAAIAASALGVHTVATVTPLRAWLTGERGLPGDSVLHMLVAGGAMAAAVAVYFAVQALLVGTARGLITSSWTLRDMLGDRRTNLFILTTLSLAVCAGVAQAFFLPLMLVVVPIVVHTTRAEQQLKQVLADREQLKLDAFYDPLTGVRNRRGFDAEAPMTLLDDQQAGVGTVLAFLDLDHFKQLNSRLGHIGADTVLKAVAALLRSHLRSADLLCRWGGEEFAIMLARTGTDEALVIAERIRSAVEDLRVTVTKPSGGKPIELNAGGVPGCTISIGIAVAPEHGTELGELYEIANQALHDAKGRGRNRVVLAPPRAGHTTPTPART